MRFLFRGWCSATADEQCNLKLICGKFHCKKRVFQPDLILKFKRLILITSICCANNCQCRPFQSCFAAGLSLGSCRCPAHEAAGGKKFMAEGYCVKCKAKREIADGVEETMKNGRKAIKGKCPVCGTVMFKILGGKAAPAAPTTPPVTS
jgi:hypothetical protein